MNRRASTSVRGQDDASPGTTDVETASGRRARSVGRDAFISYRHDPDAPVALALKRGLERLAKPWNRRRALSVFLDDANLGAVDDLPQRIERELLDADFLIVLACPESAASHWVTREVTFWCHRKGPKNVILVLTDGELTWDEAAGRFSESSTALNADVRALLTTEAKFVDLAWARGRPDLSLRDSRFRADVADIASPIRDVAPEELESEDLRLHRRAIRLARAAVITIACLAVLAAIAAFVARANERKADRRAREALGRSIGLASLDLPASDLDEALLLSLVSADLDRGGGPDRYRASRTLIGRYSRLSALLYAGAADNVGLRGVAIAPDGRTVYATAWRDDGTGDLVSWPAGQRTEPGRVPLPASLDPSMRAAGRGPNVVGVVGGQMAMIAPGGSLQPIGDRVLAVDDASMRALVALSEGSATLVDLGRGGTVADVPSASGPIDLHWGRLALGSSSGVALLDARDGRQLATSAPGPAKEWRAIAVGQEDSSAVVSVAPDGSLVRWRRVGAQLVPDPPIGPFDEIGSPARLVLSADGRKVLAVGDRGADLVDVETGQRTIVASGPVGLVVTDPSATYAAVAGARLSVWDLPRVQRVFAVPKPANALAWSSPCDIDARCRLVSAGESIDVWEPGDLRHIELADQTNAQAVAIDADGSTVATAGWGSSVAVWELGPTGGANGRALAAAGERPGTVDPSSGQLAWFDGATAVDVGLDGTTYKVATGPHDKVYIADGSTRLLTVSGGGLQLWDVRAGVELPLDRRCATGRYAVSPSGGMVAGHDPATGLTVVCATKTGTVVAGAKVQAGPASRAAVIAVDDDGSVALGGNDGYVALLPRRDRALLEGAAVDVRLGGEPAVVTSLAVRKGTLVAGVKPNSGSRGADEDRDGFARVLIWDAVGGGTPVQFETDHREVEAVALLGAGAEHVVVAERDQPGDQPVLQVWETATRRRLGRALLGLQSGVVTLGGDAAKVVAADDRGSVYEWSLDEDPKNEICAIVGRDFTRDEWKTVAGGVLADRPYSAVCP